MRMRTTGHIIAAGGSFMAVSSLLSEDLTHLGFAGFLMLTAIFFMMASYGEEE